MGFQTYILFIKKGYFPLRAEVLRSCNIFMSRRLRVPFPFFFSVYVGCQLVGLSVSQFVSLSVSQVVGAVAFASR